jgi:hypothetical protein
MTKEKTSPWAIKHIHESETAGLIPHHQAQEPKYYTLTPDPDPVKASEGWTTVTYYTVKD